MPKDSLAYNAEYYRTHRERELFRVRSRQQTRRDWLRSLRSIPCADCDQSFHPVQMDFDHRVPASKSFRITAGGPSLASTARLRHEIDKCDVVCANCHRIRTTTRQVVSPPKINGSPYLARKRGYWQSQAALLDRLRRVPCMDCFGRFPSCAMDFDHRPGTFKRSGVTRMVGRAGTDAILAEAAKCDIVCANCHRWRTHQRRQIHSERE